MKYDSTSIGTRITSSTGGTPSGTNSRRKCAPCLTKPMIVTPMNTASASAKVTTMWLVMVKL